MMHPSFGRCPQRNGCSQKLHAVRFSMPLNKRVDVRDLEGELSTLIHLSRLELNGAYPHKLIMACLQP